jgi:glycosyltransferase involved in cell wall biosynthesis
MRVLHVIPSVAPRYGGPSYAVLGYCRALRARGLETMIATTNADGDSELRVRTGAPTTYQGLDAVFFSRRGEAFKYSGALARWLRQNVAGFDVVHIHAVFSHASLAAGRACRAHGVPYVLRPLGTLDPWSLTQRAWKKRVLLATSVRTLVGRAAAIHFTAAEEQRLAAPITGPVPGVVIPPGVDDRYLAARPSPMAQRERRIVALARLDPKKRLDALIRAFHVVASMPGLTDWRLTVAGDGPADCRAALLQLARSGPASERIEFPGWIDGDRKQHLLGRSAIFALPSHQENFGLALVEAMACGVPAVVSASVNLSPDVARVRAGWVADDTDAGLADALRSAMGDEEERGRRAQAARGLAVQFTWAASAERLEALYASVCGHAVGAGR